jgi:two-component sensor histidine kinase
VIFSSQLHPNLFPSSGGRVNRQFYTKVSALDFKGRFLALFSLEDVSELNQKIMDYRLSNQKAQKEIEQRKVAEKILRKTLDEREILIREVHHRVKNSLQLIMGLIFIHKAELGEGDSLIPVLDELWQRIQSVSLIHDKLYRSSDLVELDTKEYLESLVSTLLANLTDLKDKVEVFYEVPPIDIGIDKTIHLGLITAELLTNAIKYSFNPQGGGKLRVMIQKIPGEPKLRFSLANFPNTLKKDYTPGQSSGLGMSVIGMVMEQLQTQLDVHNGKWSEFSFVFANEE